MRTAGFCPPLMLTSPTPGQLRNFLREPRVGEILNFRQRQRLRSQRQSQDRRIGGIGLAVDRRRREIARQKSLRRIDRRLHFLFGDIDVEIERKLQRDDRAAPSSWWTSSGSSPGTCPNWRSSGAVTEDAMTSGLAPG